MKILFVVALVFAVTQIEGRSVDSSNANLVFTPLQQECLNELQLNEQKEAIASLNNRAICPEDNINYNKFISCFWKKTGRQNANGGINYDTIKLFVREGIIRALGEDAVATDFAEVNSVKIVNGCKNIEGSGAEQVAVKVRNCIVRGLNAIGPN